MQGFYQKFPQLLSNDFWITGESYGGHYVPNAAARIVHANELKQGAHINLKGFMVGNAWTGNQQQPRGGFVLFCNATQMPPSTTEAPLTFGSSTVRSLLRSLTVFL